MVGIVKMDKHIKENNPVQPLAEEEHNSIIEETAGPRGCGGRFRFLEPDDAHRELPADSEGRR
jgi:hypothetical protein